MPAESPATPTRPPVPSLAVSPTSPVYDSAAQDPSQDPVVHIPLWVGVLVRIVLFFYVGASGFFQERVETTTPVNGWKRFKEGLYLYQHGIPPYEGGVFHQAPLLLPVFTYLPPILVPILFISLDYAIARCLVAIAAHKRNLQLMEHWPEPSTKVVEPGGIPEGVEEETDVVDELRSGLHGGETQTHARQRRRSSSANRRGSRWADSMAEDLRAAPMTPTSSDMPKRRRSSSANRRVHKADTLATSEAELSRTRARKNSLKPSRQQNPLTIVPPWHVLSETTEGAPRSAIGARKQSLKPGSSSSSDPTKPVDVLINPTDVGSMYLLNPLSVITCLSQSTLLFMFLAIVVALRQAIEGNRKTAVAGVAVAAYLGLYPVMMVVPVTLLLVGAKTKAIKRELKTTVPLLVLYTSALLGLSYLLVGTWDFLNATYGVILFVPDLTPNIGLFWYFFTEMFDSFRTFFLCVFQIMAFAFVIPIGLVLRDHPLFIAYVYTGIMAVFKSYPTVGDTALFLAFFSMHREVHKYMRHLYITATALFIALLLGPLFHHLWIYAGSGNANFFYAITLVFNLAVVVCLTDSVGALGIREWERTHGEGRRGRWVLVHK